MPDNTPITDIDGGGMPVNGDNLRTRIAAEQREHRLVTRMVGRKTEKSCLCGWRSPERDRTCTDHPEHVADAVIAELNIPDRIHIDDQGRTWDWCGGQPGTWAWRMTAKPAGVQPMSAPGAGFGVNLSKGEGRLTINGQPLTLIEEAWLLAEHAWKECNDD